MSPLIAFWFPPTLTLFTTFPIPPLIGFWFNPVPTTFVCFKMPLLILYIISTYLRLEGKCATNFCVPSPCIGYFFFTYRLFLRNPKMWIPTNLSAAHMTQNFQFRHLNFSPTILDIHFLFTRHLPNYTFCLPSV